MMKKDGFTLLELLLIIIILGVLAALLSGQFITSLKKGRDAKRKTDLEQIQRALDFYYEDNRVYPSAGTGVGQLDLENGTNLCHPSGCDTKTYIYKLPQESKSGCIYGYVHYGPASANGEGYGLYSTLENRQDEGPGADQNGYNDTTCYPGASEEPNGCPCLFKVTSPNYP